MNQISPLQDKEGMRSEAIILSDKAGMIQIQGQEDLDFASALLGRIREIGDRIRGIFDPLIKQAFDHHRALIAEKKKFTDQLDRAEGIVKPKIAAYIQAQDEARFKAEREAVLARKEAERKGDQAIDQAHLHIDRGEFEEATKVMIDASREIDDLKEKALAIPPKPDTPSLGIREVWKFEITNQALIPRKFLCPDEVLIGKFVRALKHQAEIPGVRIYSEKTPFLKGER